MAKDRTSYFEHPDVIPGIQPFGFMFILNDEKKIIQVSKNVANYLNQPPEEFIYKNLFDIILPSSEKAMTSFFKDQNLKQKTFFEVYFGPMPERSWLGSIYKFSGGYVFEIEANLNATVDFTYFESILDTSIYFGSSETLEDIFEAGIKVTKEITGYDKVILFRYDEVNLGEIVAQSGERSNVNGGKNFYYDYLYSLSSFKFYNSLIYLPDLDFKSTEFFPGIDRASEFIAAGQLWATNNSFLNFLRNSGAGSFIGINIVINKNTWGRIACFNTVPKEVNHYGRQKLTFLGQLISSTIAMKLMERSNYREATFQILQARLSEAMSSYENYIEGLRNSVDSLLRLGNADGVAWHLEEKTECFGASPSIQTVEEISKICWQIVEGENKSAFYSDSLSRDISSFNTMKEIASGILFLPISHQERQYILWFRPEKIKYISYLKNIILGQEAPVTKEKIEGFSNPWNKEDIDNIFKFKNNLTNYIIQNSARLKLNNERLENLVAERTKVLEKENKMRKKAERIMRESMEELQRSNSELENFAYVASHDLQEPLRKIQAFSDRLKMLTKDKLDEKSEDYFNRMTAAARRMQNLINDLLSYSRVTTQANPFQPIDLNDLFRNVISDLQVKIEEKNAQIIVDHFDQTIHGDAHQLQRVFQNLIQNALKFSKKDATPLISISWKKNGRRCRITVKDNGIGFGVEYSDKIFQLFERLHGRSEFEGTGLGLAISKKIVERHHGQIKTNSQPGHGSEFIVELPIKQK